MLRFRKGSPEEAAAEIPDIPPFYRKPSSNGKGNGSSVGAGGDGPARPNGHALGGGGPTYPPNLGREAGSGQTTGPAPTQPLRVGGLPGVASLGTGREWRFFLAALLVADALALVAAAVAGGYVRYEEFVLPKTYPGLREKLGLLALFVGLFWAAGWRTGIYRRDNLLGGPGEYERVFHAGVYSAVGLMILGYLLNLPPLPRSWWVILLVAGVFLACLVRFGLRRVAYRLRRRGLFTTRLLIAGASEQGIAIARQLLWSRGSGFQVAGFLDDYLPAGSRVPVADPRDPGVGEGTAAGYLEVLGSSNRLSEVVAELGIQEVIVVPQAISWEGLQGIVASHGAHGGPRVHLSAGLYDLVTASMVPCQWALVPLLTLGSRRLVGLDRLLKSTFDQAVAGLLLACLWPALTLLVLAGWLKGIRPAIEYQEVVGQGGRPVQLPLLRKEITERLPWRGLPALFRVLDGGMSLVGPRPIAVGDALEYGQWAPLLTAMKPGLTGYWRLLPEGAPLEEVGAWDLWYLRNYSIWTDLFVLFQSARRVLRLASAPQEAVQRWSEEPQQGAGLRDASPERQSGADRLYSRRADRSLDPARGYQ